MATWNQVNIKKPTAVKSTSKMDLKHLLNFPKKNQTPLLFHSWDICLFVPYGYDRRHITPGPVPVAMALLVLLIDLARFRQHQRQRQPLAPQNLAAS